MMPRTHSPLWNTLRIIPFAMACPKRFLYTAAGHKILATGATHSAAGLRDVDRNVAVTGSQADLAVLESLTRSNAVGRSNREGELTRGVSRREVVDAGGAQGRSHDPTDEQEGLDGSRARGAAPLVDLHEPSLEDFRFGVDPELSRDAVSGQHCTPVATATGDVFEGEQNRLGASHTQEQDRCCDRCHEMNSHLHLDPLFDRPSRSFEPNWLGFVSWPVSTPTDSREAESELSVGRFKTLKRKFETKL